MCAQVHTRTDLLFQNKANEQWLGGEGIIFSLLVLWEQKTGRDKWKREEGPKERRPQMFTLLFKKAWEEVYSCV